MGFCKLFRRCQLAENNFLLILTKFIFDQLLIKVNINWLQLEKTQNN